ncbi:uncharacterized protein LOC114461247 isoform X2 [Gouania willdenowi]|uniref:uncharacterized protein LOC114461247 isoform X2 n=1 Tax=Gouania willdenowi TaxID=441366 RepID=UPI001055C02C|nr:uncharacterized protein LOC114461247 isoform X2 [Gouania willdenowi]
MSTAVDFHSQVASIMEVLANAAVVEICKVVDESYAVVQMEVSRSQKESEALRRRVKLLELQISRYRAERGRATEGGRLLSRNSRDPPAGPSPQGRTKFLNRGPGAVQKDHNITLDQDPDQEVVTTTKTEAIETKEENEAELVIIKVEEATESRAEVPPVLGPAPDDTTTSTINQLSSQRTEWEDQGCLLDTSAPQGPDLKTGKVQEVPSRPEDSTLQSGAAHTDRPRGPRNTAVGPKVCSTDPNVTACAERSLVQNDNVWVFSHSSGTPEGGTLQMHQNHIDHLINGGVDNVSTANSANIAKMSLYMGERSDQRPSLLQKLKRKWPKASYRDNNDYMMMMKPSDQRRFHLLNNTCASKMTRKIELGWIHEKKQVRKRRGGGTMRLDLSKAATKTDILAHAQNLFFPNMASSKGTWDQFCHDIVDFQETPLMDGVTVGELYDSHRGGMLRFYLMTESLSEGDHVFSLNKVTLDQLMEQEEDPHTDDLQSSAVYYC